MLPTGVLSQTDQKSSNPVKVMIVDDSAFMRFAIAQQLNEHPEIQVIGTASNGKEALSLIPELQPDVITLDVEMPKMDGLTTLASDHEELSTAGHHVQQFDERRRV